MKRFLMLFFLLLFVSVASAGQRYATDREIFERGIRVGMEFERELIRARLAEYREIVENALNYKILFFAGEVPPPLVVEKLTEKRQKDGTVRLVKELLVKPPACFPVAKIRQLQVDLTSTEVEYPAGWFVFFNAKGKPLERVAYVYHIAKVVGAKPVYLPSEEKLVISSFQRRADAEKMAALFSDAGVKVEVVSGGPLKFPGTSVHPDAVREFAELVKAMIKKESEIVNSPVRVGEGYAAAILYLEKARHALEGVDNAMAAAISRLVERIQRRAAGDN